MEIRKIYTSNFSLGLNKVIEYHGMNYFIFLERANNGSKYKQSSLTTPDNFGRNKEAEISNKDKINSLNNDSTLSNSSSKKALSMQRINHTTQNSDCVGLQNVELIPPPTYNEATFSPNLEASEVKF